MVAADGVPWLRAAGHPQSWSSKNPELIATRAFDGADIAKDKGWCQ